MLVKQTLNGASEQVWLPTAAAMLPSLLYHSHPLAEDEEEDWDGVRVIVGPLNPRQSASE